jgi:ABC-type lipoprotein export system ATPase subunit
VISFFSFFALGIAMDNAKNLLSAEVESSFSELAERSKILKQAKVVLGRVRIQKAEKSIIINGPRGSGKTALLNEIERLARNEGYETIFHGCL